MKIPVQHMPVICSHSQKLVNQGISPAYIQSVRRHAQPCSHSSPFETGFGFIPPCPTGTELIMFEMPVYDSEGLFIIGFELVPFCIPENRYPAG
jgi:hypothetical protein